MQRAYIAQPQLRVRKRVASHYVYLRPRSRSHSLSHTEATIGLLIKVTVAIQHEYVLDNLYVHM